MHKGKITYQYVVNYLKRKLSNKERYALEKEALDDSFLEDALDGFETLDVGDLENDIELLSKEIKSQSAPSTSSFNYLYPIAASLLLLLGFSFWWFSHDKTIVAPEIVYEVIEKEEILQDLDSLSITTPEVAFQEEKTVDIEEPTGKKIAEPVTSKKVVEEEVGIQHEEVGLDEILEEAAVVSDSNEVNDDIENPLEDTVKEVEAVVAIPEDSQKTSSQSSFRKEVSKPKKFNGNQKKVEISTATIEVESEGQVLSQKLETPFPQITISGQVTSDGEPLEGVSVLIRGGDIDAMVETDAKGNYLISTKKGTTLSFYYFGYERKEFLIDTSQKLDIELLGLVEDLFQAVENNNLGEEAEKQEYTTVVIEAIPFNSSIENFKIWVQNRLDIEYPEVVFNQNITLELNVDSFGSVSILKSLSYLSKDQKKAFKDIIDKSYEWTPAQNKDEKNISSTLIITFEFRK